jgi:hypothetical protein
LPDQPIFYPVTNEDYAVQIARDWNVKASGAGFVTKFEVQSDYLSRFRVQQVGGALHTEYWIPAEDLHTFNEKRCHESQRQPMRPLETITGGAAATEQVVRHNPMLQAGYGGHRVVEARFYQMPIR